MLDEQMSEEDIEEGLTLGSLMDHEHYWSANDLNDTVFFNQLYSFMTEDSKSLNLSHV